MADPIRVRSPRLAARLVEKGCFPITEHTDGSKDFSRTDTVRRIVKEYADEIDMSRARQSFRNTPRIR